MLDRVRSPVIEAYWAPGCSSCLRMKEFLEKHDVAFTAVNVAESPASAEKLRAFGLIPPAIVVGDKAVAGLDLTEVARLVGFAYDPPAMLSPPALRARYDVVSETLVRLVAQLDPERLHYTPPDRDRSLAALAGHAGLIMRSFLEAYRTDSFDCTLEVPQREFATADELTALANETRTLFHAWWDRFGHDDPLDRVVQTTWGHPNLHELLERAVWHTAQHTRQLAFFIQRLGLTPDRPLRPEDLAGLPLPEGIHAGNDVV